MRIRVAQAPDSEGMRECSARNFPQTLGIDHFRRTLSTWPGLSYVVVNKNDHIVGCVLVRLREDARKAVRAHIDMLSILPQYHRRGFGRKMLSLSLQCAKVQYGATKVTLHVAKSNKVALAFYEVLGFSAVMEEPGYYEDGEGAFVMAIKL